MLYNIDHGGRDNTSIKGRWNKLSKVIKKNNPDILFILEAWTWTRKELNEFAKKNSFQYSFMSKSNTKHNLALLSNLKPKKINFNKQGFHHSIIHAVFDINKKLKNLHIFQIHLSPIAEDIRIKEAKKILQKVKKLDNYIIIGDFNSLSPEDKYNERLLIKQLQKEGIKKFGERKLEKKVISKFLSNRAIDLHKKFINDNKIYYSVPTKMCTDKDHFAKIRLDYAFTSENIFQQVKNIKIIKNKLTNHASDHYPLIIEFKKG